MMTVFSKCVTYNFQRLRTSNNELGIMIMVRKCDLSKFVVATLERFDEGYFAAFRIAQYITIIW